MPLLHLIFSIYIKAVEGLGNQNEATISLSDKMREANNKLEVMLFDLVVVKEEYEEEVEKLKTIMEQVVYHFTLCCGKMK